MADGLNPFAGVEWAQPWYMPYRELGEALTAAVGVHGLLPALNAHAQASNSPVRFVSELSLPAGRAYEQFVFDTHQVPTRVNLHDAFNALVWLRFPALKTTLNRVQAAQLAIQKPGDPRGPVRDAVTVFDENGAFLLNPPTNIWQALRAHQWQEALHTQRSWWAESQRLCIVGHALLEKLCQPRKPIVAHVLHVEAQASDKGLAMRVAQEFSTPPAKAPSGHKRYQPIPVLGIPSWHADNAKPEFYADSSVFRSL